MNPKSKIWILAIGRFLSQLGSGFILFYAPIFFVNQVGLSASLVGIAIGSASISGIFGRFLGGSLADWQGWGRKRTLLISAIICSLGDFLLAFTYDFTTLIGGNLLMGFGVGLYWPATEAVVADLTAPEKRNEAFATTRFADTLGLGIGTILGGGAISASVSYRLLFVVDAISFLVFFAIIYFAISETYQPSEDNLDSANVISNWQQGWKIALSDRALGIYAIVNILFTTYIAQVESTLPLYFKNFVGEGGFSTLTITGLFTGHIILISLSQIPIVRWLNRLTRINILNLSLCWWFFGFILVWLTGGENEWALIWASLAMAVLAIAIVCYLPAASSLVVDLAPPSLRGIYLSINSQCWGIGYLIGPPLGGFALDRSSGFARTFWLFLAGTIVIATIVLQKLQTITKHYEIQK